MLAMQYKFPLPADYDMSIITRRIHERGQLLDGFPQLKWKAYLWSRKSPDDGASANAYAPFYLWRDTAGLNAFLGSPGFASLCEDFGRPRIDIWSVWDDVGGHAMQTATVLHQQIRSIRPDQSLEELRRHETTFADETTALGALAVVTAFDPYEWRTLRLSAWSSEPGVRLAAPWERYQVGYVAHGEPVADAMP